MSDEFVGAVWRKYLRMFKNWGTWLGIENENGQKQHAESVVDVEGEQNQDINKEALSAGSETSKAEDGENVQTPLQKAKGFSGKLLQWV